MRRKLWLLVLGLAATGAVGCKDLHYFDVNVVFDNASFLGNAVSMVETCHVYVTGADTADFYVRKNCPPPNNGLTMGVFEYSTNADSGNITFTMKVYNGIPEDDPCFFGQGVATSPIGPTTTNLELKVVQMGGGC